MRLKMEVRVAARKSNKKDKQKVKKEEPESTSSSSSKDTVKVEKPSIVAAGPSTSSSSGPSTAKAPEKSLKRGKMDKLGDPEFKKAKDEYSVAEDPKASDVYKSLFTTHETEQKQDRAHWVTYNPFYN